MVAVLFKLNPDILFSTCLRLFAGEKDALTAFNILLFGVFLTSQKDVLSFALSCSLAKIGIALELKICTFMVFFGLKIGACSNFPFEEKIRMLFPRDITNLFGDFDFLETNNSLTKASVGVGRSSACGESNAVSKSLAIN